MCRSILSLRSRGAKLQGCFRIVSWTEVREPASAWTGVSADWSLGEYESMTDGQNGWSQASGHQGLQMGPRLEGLGLLPVAWVNVTLGGFLADGAGGRTKTKQGYN